MKRFLSAGEGYALFPTNITTLFFMVLLALSPMGSIYAQETSTPIPRVSTAQRIPSEFWTTTFTYYDNGHVLHRTLEDFRGKAILLDFWSVYCGACLQGFPMLKEMQIKYPDDLVILLVNSQEQEKKEDLDKLFARLDESYHLPSLMNDSYLHKLFPHGPIPHYVWVGKDGKVDALTRRIYFTEENVRIFLRKNAQN